MGCNEECCIYPLTVKGGVHYRCIPISKCKRKEKKNLTQRESSGLQVSNTDVVEKCNKYVNIKIST